MKQITHQDIVNYMRSLADNHLDIKDFFRMDVTEIQGAFRAGIDFPCLALESLEGDFSGSSTGNSIDNQSFAFTMLTAPVIGDFKEQNIMLDQSQIIGKELIARMRHDARVKGHLLHKAFYVSGVNYHKVGPLFLEHLYGYRFVVELRYKTELIVDVGVWKDLDSVC